MGRVEWSRLPGEEIETVIAIMLCREYPNANRPKPARGDGGIDLLVPSANGAAIYQIKGFTGNLTSTQKRHIKESWEALAKYSAANSLKISEWNLVIPENLTNKGAPSARHANGRNRQRELARATGESGTAG